MNLPEPTEIHLLLFQLTYTIPQYTTPYYPKMAFAYASPLPPPPASTQPYFIYKTVSNTHLTEGHLYSPFSFKGQI